MGFMANAVFTDQHLYAQGFQAIAKASQPMATLFKHTAFMEMWDRIKASNTMEEKAAAAQGRHMLG